MKYFVVADVHGFYTEMRNALIEAGFDARNPEHCLVSCGDAFDRGQNPAKCLAFMMQIPEERRILIRGNHEDLMEQAIRRFGFLPNDKMNGAVQTALDLTNTRNEIDALIKLRTDVLYNSYIRECRDYFETEHYIFTHGWLPARRKKFSGREFIIPDNWRQATQTGWEDARWQNGMDMWNRGARVPGKTIVCGHWHCSWGWHYLRHDGGEWDNGARFDPFIDDGIIALDTCTAYTKKVNCVVLED